MSAKKDIIKKFIEVSHVQYGGVIDEEIEDFIYKINKRKSIITLVSCAGHPKETERVVIRGVSDVFGDYTPYLAFLVNEFGWTIFFNKVVPEISSECPVVVWANGGIAPTIILRCEVFANKHTFWEATKKSFYTHFK